MEAKEVRATYVRVSFALVLTFYPLSSCNIIVFCFNLAGFRLGCCGARVRDSDLKGVRHRELWRGLDGQV